MRRARSGGREDVAAVVVCPLGYAVLSAIVIRVRQARIGPHPDSRLRSEYSVPPVQIQPRQRAERDELCRLCSSSCSAALSQRILDGAKSRSVHCLITCEDGLVQQRAVRRAHISA